MLFLIAFTIATLNPTNSLGSNVTSDFRDSISCGDTIIDYKSSNEAMVKYSFLINEDGDEGIYVTASLCGSNFSTDVYLYNSNGSLLGSDDYSGYTPCSSAAVLRYANKLYNGEYILGVASDYNLYYGQFKLQILCDDYKISCNETKTGFIHDGDAVEYEFTLSTNEYVTVSTCGSGTDIDTKLEIYDSSSSLIASNDDYCDLQSAVFIDDLSAGVYTISVDPWWYVGNYQLYVGCGLVGTTDTPAPVPVSSESSDDDDVYGNAVSGDCSFFDDGSLGPIVLDICQISIDLGYSAKYECNDNGDGIIYIEYDEADCGGNVISSTELLSDSYYEYNCNGISNGCDILKMNVDCGYYRGYYKLVQNQCSKINNTEYECVNGEVIEYKYSDNECNNFISSQSPEMDDSECSVTCKASSLHKFTVIIFAVIIQIANMLLSSH